MTDQGAFDAITEAALHAFIAQRCQRAYVHELRNGLQGIYASTDVLIRMADGKAAANMPTDKVKEIARKSLQNHERGIGEAVKQLTLQEDAAVAIDLAAALKEVCGFLGNDAAAHDVAVNFTAPEGLVVQARPSRFRLSLLAIMVRAIDSMRGGGELAITAAGKNSRVEIAFGLVSNDASLSDDKAWEFDAAAAPDLKFQEDWTRSALARLMKKEGGAIESPLEEAPREAGSHANRRVVRLYFPAN